MIHLHPQGRALIRSIGTAVILLLTAHLAITHSSQVRWSTKVSAAINEVAPFLPDAKARQPLSALVSRSPSLPKDGRADLLEASQRWACTHDLVHESEVDRTRGCDRHWPAGEWNSLVSTVDEFWRNIERSRSLVEQHSLLAKKVNLAGYQAEFEDLRQALPGLSPEMVVGPFPFGHLVLTALVVLLALGANLILTDLIVFVHLRSRRLSAALLSLLATPPVIAALAWIGLFGIQTTVSTNDTTLLLAGLACVLSGVTFDLGRRARVAAEAARRHPMMRGLHAFGVSPEKPGVGAVLVRTLDHARRTLNDVLGIRRGGLATAPTLDHFVARAVSHRILPDLATRAVFIVDSILVLEFVLRAKVIGLYTAYRDQDIGAIWHGLVVVIVCASIARILVDAVRLRLFVEAAS